jgi:hypothetical protein
MAFVVQVSCVFPFVAMLIALNLKEPPLERSDRHYLDDLRMGFSLAWSNRQVRWTVALGSIVMAGATAPFILSQPLLIHYDVPTRLFGVFHAPMGLATVAGALVAYRLTARFGAKGVILSAVVGLPIAYAALWVFRTEAAFLFFGLPAIARGLLKPTLDTYINQRIPSDLRATILSIWSIALSVQIALLEPALGFVTDGSSVLIAGLFAGAWFATLLVPLYPVWLQADRLERRLGTSGPPVRASAAPTGG